MTRPFAWIGFSFLGALSVASFFGTGVSAAAAVAGAVFVLFTFFLRRRVTPLLVGVLSAALAFSLYLLCFQLQVVPVLGLDGKTCLVSGVVRDYPEEEYHRLAYSVRVEELSWENRPGPSGFTMRISSSEALECRPGDRISVPVTFYAFQDGAAYSSGDVLYAKGIFMGGYVADYGGVTITPREGLGPKTLLAELRKYLSRSVERLLPPEEGGLMKAMLLGNRDGISPKVQETFRSIGASHILVISGLHMSILCAVFMKIFRRLKGKERTERLLTALAILLFLTLIGFPASAVRSGIMMILFLLSRCIYREADSLNSLGAAVFLLCVTNPFAGGDVGLALSALATAGILCLQPGLYRQLSRPFLSHKRLKGPGLALAGSLSVSLAAVVGTLPVQLLVFQGLSLLAPLSSLLLIFPGTVLIYASLPVVILGSIPLLAPLAVPFAWAASLLGKLFLGLARLLEHIPLPPVAMETLPAVLVLLVMGGCCLACRREKAVWMKLVAVFLSASVFFVAGAMEYCSYGEGLTILVLNEGGDSAVALTKNGAAAVLTMEGYHTSLMKQALEQSHVKELYSMYYDSQSYLARESACRVLEKYPVGTLYVPEGAYLNRAVRELAGEERLSRLPEAASFEALPGVTIQVEEGGKLLSFQAEGLEVSIELGETSGRACDVLVTTQAESRVTSGFTVLQSDGIIEKNGELELEKKAGKTVYTEKPGRGGSYALSSPGRVMRIQLENGTIQIRRNA